MQKILWLTLGWILTIAGIVILPLPIPIPLIGALPLLLGLAILTTHSKVIRRMLQYTRHRM